MPTALFLSPHLDDVAFSCGGTVAALAAAGWRCVVATAFTRSVPNPTGFALACQLDKGLPAAADYMALRRAEDAAAAAALGAEPRWLDLPEAPHRGYASAAALFAAVRPDDDAAAPLAPLVADLCRDLGPAAVFAPQGLGGHVDHRHLIRAVVAAAAGPVRWYRDTPYAVRDPAARPAPELPAGLAEFAEDVTAALPAKLAACACYATQLGFQFGGPGPMRAALAAFAAREAARLGRGGAAEAFRAAAPA